MTLLRLGLTALLLGMLAMGCAPRIGDACAASTNCSVNGDRLCDVTMPRGYCTVFDCTADACPDDAVCVRFQPVPARLARNVCMRRCGSDGECRVNEGYTCVGEADLGGRVPSADLFEIVDVNRRDGRFCMSPQ